MHSLVLVAREADGAAHIAAAGGHERRRGRERVRAVAEGRPGEGVIRLRLGLRQLIRVYAAEMQPAEVVLRRIRPDQRREIPVLRAALVHIYPVRVRGDVRVNLLKADGTDAFRLVNELCFHSYTFLKIIWQYVSFVWAKKSVT